MQRDLARMATTDPLSGLLNRRAFFERADEVCSHAAAGSRLAAIMFDIDHFKRINDTYGHGVGDQVIRAVSSAAASLNEVAGRLGGEEYAILLRDRALPDAIAVAEQLRADIAALDIKSQGHTVKLSCSFGVDEWEFGDTIDDLLRRADVALYQAKSAGRNRVTVYNPSSGGGPAKGSGIIRSGDR
jgi:diguanylate cyclase (GGDEF)-like protein